MEQFYAELVVNSHCLLGEGPIWREQNNTVYWLDINGKYLHSYNLLNEVFQTCSLSLKISSFALIRAGEDGAIAVGENGLYRMELSTGQLQAIANPEENRSGLLFNDGKCDIKGRFYTGTIAKDMSKGAFYRFDERGKGIKLFGDVGCSNGIAWSLDWQTMYYIDSLLHSVDAFDFNVERGEIDNRRTIIQFDKHIMPDGMSIDSEGMLWVAEWGGSCVSRWNPYTSERLAVVHVPAKYVTSCSFAGESLDELYITSANKNPSEDQLFHEPYAGGLFKVKTGYKGTAYCYFENQIPWYKNGSEEEGELV